MRNDRYFNYKQLTQDKLNSFTKNGYLIIKNLITEEGLRQMRQECMQAWAREKEAFDPSKTWLQNFLLVNIYHQSQGVRDYYFERPLEEIASQIIGPDIKVATSQLTFKMRGITKPFGWH